MAPRRLTYRTGTRFARAGAVAVRAVRKKVQGAVRKYVSQRVPRALSAVAPALAALGQRRRGMYVSVPRGYKPSYTQRKVFRTRGYGPKNFKRGMRPRGDIFKKLGSEAIYEAGASDSDAHCVTIGHHSAPLIKILESFWRAVWRKLMMLNGIHFTDWDALFQQYEINAPSLILLLRKQPDAAPITIAISGPIAGTYWSHYKWALDFSTAFYDAIDSTYQNIILCEIGIQHFGGANVFWTARLDLSNIMFHFKSTSTMVIQNRTLGSTATDTDATDVSNNPIIGRSWTVRGNQMRPAYNKGTNVNSTADVSDGLIVGGVITTVLNKYNAPTAYMFQKSNARVNVQPGEIKKSFVGGYRKMSGNALMNLLLPYINLSTTTANPATPRIVLGESRLFQFEKLCDSRDEATGINIGYEINVRVASYVSIKRQETGRIAFEV